MKAKTVQIAWHDKGPVNSVDFHPDGFFVTAGSDKDVRVRAAQALAAMPVLRAALPAGLLVQLARPIAPSPAAPCQPPHPRAAALLACCADVGAGCGWRGQRRGQLHCQPGAAHHAGELRALLAFRCALMQTTPAAVPAAQPMLGRGCVPACLHTSRPRARSRAGRRSQQCSTPPCAGDTLASAGDHGEVVLWQQPGASAAASVGKKRAWEPTAGARNGAAAGRACDSSTHSTRGMHAALGRGCCAARCQRQALRADVLAVGVGCVQVNSSSGRQSARCEGQTRTCLTWPGRPTARPWWQAASTTRPACTMCRPGGPW